MKLSEIKPAGILLATVALVIFLAVIVGRGIAVSIQWALTSIK